MPNNGVKQNPSSDSMSFDLEVAGILDADFKLPKLPGTPFEQIRVNWAELRYVNSSGIVTWLKWVHEVRQSQPGIQFTFVNCPVFLAHIMNSVKGFLPKNSRIQSFEVPFQCERCNKGDSQTFLVKLDNETLQQPLSIADLEALLKTNDCKQTDCGLELDVSPTFFNFLKTNS